MFWYLGLLNTDVEYSGDQLSLRHGLPPNGFSAFMRNGK